MSSIQCKNTRHSKKQENIGSNQKKSQSIEIDREMIKIVELVYTDFKIAVINVLLKSTKVEKNMSIIRRKMKDISRKKHKLNF